MKNLQLAMQLQQLVKKQKEYSKPYAKVMARAYEGEPEYLVTDGYMVEDFRTLREAQHYVTTLDIKNDQGFYEVSKLVGDRLKSWYGEISYGPEKFKWFERVD